MSRSTSDAAKVREFMRFVGDQAKGTGRTAPRGPAVPPHLPGADLVAAGIAALRRRDFTVEALLVAVGAPRLRRAGLEIPDAAAELETPELALYAALRARGRGDAHSQYNALIRRLVSFERALEAVRRRERGSRQGPASAGAGGGDAQAR